MKITLPTVLKGLEDPQWRSKQASILLLGSMAFCAPAQLSSCLPQIVPKLSECFMDTHPKVRSAAESALSVRARARVCTRWCGGPNRGGPGRTSRA